MTDGIGGSLRISTEAIAKIAKVAALEVDGIDDIVTPSQSIRALLGNPKQQKPIRVEMKEDEARLNRTKSRDDALDSLKKSLKGTGLSG